MTVIVEEDRINTLFSSPAAFVRQINCLEYDMCVRRIRERNLDLPLSLSHSVRPTATAGTAGTASSMKKISFSHSWRPWQYLRSQQLRKNGGISNALYLTCILFGRAKIEVKLF